MCMLSPALELIKIGRSRRVPVASIAGSQLRVRRWKCLRRVPRDPASRRPGQRRRRAMCSRHDPLWTTADVVGFFTFFFVLFFYFFGGGGVCVGLLCFVV